MKGRAVSLTGDVAAFLPGGKEKPDTITIRINGPLISPGIYQVPKAKEGATVTNMTLVVSGNNLRINGSIVENVYSGDVIAFMRKGQKHAEISREKMSVSEEMLLGIPLDPNRMSASDWENLPGIGPVMADRIVMDRQINGGFSSVRDLLRVSGIGEVRVKQIERYFRHDLTY
ncbi:MAG: helix-hairpin-helix domain-containing protein [Deltaproteobacteria bacterium]|nr:helix-hairpin-helix domain-containing protein [Deltaproteobacteria bacterium]